MPWEEQEELGSCEGASHELLTFQIALETNKKEVAKIPQAAVSEKVKL